jgi:hypothetical protein
LGFSAFFIKKHNYGLKKIGAGLFRLLLLLGPYAVADEFVSGYIEGFQSRRLDNFRRHLDKEFLLYFR